MVEAETVCEVHSCQMPARSIRVVYGLRRGLKRSPAYLSARRDRFPHCGDWVNGGCVVGEAGAVRQAVCPACVAVRDACLAERHPSWVAPHDPGSG